MDMARIYAFLITELNFPSLLFLEMYSVKKF